MKEAGRSLPMWATGFMPTPWTQQAVLLVGNLLSYGGLVVSQQENERILLELVQAGVSDDKMRELFSPLFDEADFDLLRQLHIRRQLSDEALELITDLPRLAGSNAWAVRPQRSASGGALLATDPHLEINRLPAIWYEAVLRWGPRPSITCWGPRCPAARCLPSPAPPRWPGASPISRATRATISSKIAGPAAAPAGNIAAAEHLARFRSAAAKRSSAKGTRPKSSTSITIRKARWKPTPAGRRRRAIIFRPLDRQRRRGRPIDRHLAGNRRRRHGGRSHGHRPRLPAADALLGLCRPRRATSAGKPTAGFPIGRGTSAACCRCRPGTSGIIGAAGCGPKCCRRPINPPAGFVASANEDINAPGGPRLVTMIVPDYRRRRIDERLAELDEATLDDMQALQYDVVSLQARELLPIFLPHLPEGEIKRRLAGWDCSYDPRASRRPGSRGCIATCCWRSSARSEGIGWRRMLYLATPRRLFDDAAHGDRPAAGPGAIAVVAGARQRRADPPGGRKAGPRAARALERDQRIPFHQSLHRRRLRRPGVGLQHRRNGDARLPRHAFFKAIC